MAIHGRIPGICLLIFDSMSGRAIPLYGVWRGWKKNRPIVEVLRLRARGLRALAGAGVFGGSGLRGGLFGRSGGLVGGALFGRGSLLTRLRRLRGRLLGRSAAARGSLALAGRGRIAFVARVRFTGGGQPIRVGCDIGFGG